MNFFDTISRMIFGSVDRSRPDKSASKFFDFDFSSQRFECNMGTMAGTGDCRELFLNRFTGEDIEDLLDKSGIINILNSCGFAHHETVLSKDDGAVHRLLIYDGKPSPERLLVDLRISELTYIPDSAVTGGMLKRARFAMLAVEWLTLQNPAKGFDPDRPPLPGQNHPGLGGVNQVIALIERFAAETGASGILDVPEQFHAAAMYSRRFRFVDPEREAMVRAVLRDLHDYRLPDIAWGFATGTVYEKNTGQPARYHPAEQIFPIDRQLTDYFNSPRYRRRVTDAMKIMHFEFDHEKMKSSRSKMK